MRQRGSSISIGIIVIVVIVIAAVLVDVYRSYHRTQTAKTDIATKLEQSKLAAGQIERDKVRQKHVAELASRLFTQTQVLKQPVAENQTGLDSLAKGNDDTALQDPSTNKPYVYVHTASEREMKTGDVTFRSGATCGVDNLIVDATPSSVAVVIKLEYNNEYACQTNL